MTAYYNDIDSYCCDWLSNLMDAGLITSGKIDDRSIADLSPDDVRGYDRAHFFAGIAGWDLALQFAGWPADRHVWTGSCPCQPFSAAGKRSGAADERHLWPHWFRLIRECRPGIIFGENVAAAIGWGWLDAVLGDLEAEDYATGAAVLGACSVGAPHIRRRVWFVADAYSARRQNDCRRPRSETPLNERIVDPKSDLAGWRPPQWDSGFPKPGDGCTVDGISSRVDAVRAYGNAIVPQVAAEFILSYS